MAKNDSIVDESLLMLAILTRIPHNRSISSVELAHELEESGIVLAKRRLQRFLKRLATAEDFAVVCDTRTRPYGYRRTQKNSDIASTRLRPEECLVLRLAQEHMKYLYPAPVMESLRPVFDKARESMKELPVSDPAAGWMKKVAVAPVALHFMPPQVLPRIFQAVSRALWRNVKLDIEYENSEGSLTKSMVSPLGLVQQGERSYLVCIFEGYGDVRHLALHRIRTAQVLSFASERPAGFSLDAYVAGRHFNYSNGQKVQLVLESASESLKRYLMETPFNPSQKLTELEGGFWRVEAVLDDTVLIDAWITAWGAGIFRRIERKELSV